jgi:hypothetical protein
MLAHLGDHDASRSINAMDLKDLLGQIEPTRPASSEAKRLKHGEPRRQDDPELGLSDLPCQFMFV